MKRLDELAQRNPETKDFADSYPEEKDREHEIDLSRQEEEAKRGKVPLLLQWDKRWGYREYSGTLAGLSRCGPTVLSMAAIWYFEDSKYDPVYMMNFSRENGYVSEGSGSLHSLIYDGGEKLGMKIENADIQTIPSYLENGNPVICLMGPGDFTSSGHFIILTGVQGEGEDMQVTLNDPNSPARSEKRWDFETIKNQTRGSWRVVKNG